jgi:hypothetical protein
MSSSETVKRIRAKVKKTREREWMRDAYLLRHISPDESLQIMFDLIAFGEQLHEAGKHAKHTRDD